MTTTPNIIVREYHPETGALLSNVTTLSFGRITKGTHSRVKVIDISFGNATSVGNVKLGLVSDAGITVNPDPASQESDGTTWNGHFGIESSQSFDPSKTSEPLSRHFAGLNASGESSDVNNVTVGMRSSTVTNYIYLDVESGSSDSAAGNGGYKIFIDFS